VSFATRGRDVSITMRKIRDPKHEATSPLRLDLRVDQAAYETTVPRDALRQDAPKEVMQETEATDVLTNAALGKVIAPLLPKKHPLVG